MTEQHRADLRRNGLFGGADRWRGSRHVLSARSEWE
jgi:hypothetical protein